MSDFYIAKSLDLAYACRSGFPQFTLFLDPLRAGMLIKKAPPHIFANSYGGYEDAERLMIGFSSDGMLEPQNFPINAITINCQAKSKLEHRDILGAILGLGIKREYIGDVILTPRGAVVIAASRMVDFVVNNLVSVGKAAVYCNLLSEDEPFFGLNNKTEDKVSTASARLDAVSAAVFGISRKDASKHIEAGRAYINWQQVSSPTKQLKVGDMFTLRGFGRIKIEYISKNSRNDKLIIKILRY